MPNIKRSRSRGTHFTSNTRRLITIISPSFLITKYLIVLFIALSKNLLVKNCLLTDISENRPIIVKAILARPKALKTLLIGMIIASNHHANDETMLHKRLNKVAMRICSERESSGITKRSTLSSRCRALYDLINVNGYPVTSKVFRPL